VAGSEQNDIDNSSLRVDGNLIPPNSTTKTGSPSAWNTFTVGNNAYGRFGGLIDEVRIYATGLTAEQASFRYRVGLEELLARGLIDQEEYQERLAKG
jgi:hypothetical protein